MNTVVDPDLAQAAAAPVGRTRRAGDVILEVGQEPVASPADVTRRIDQLKRDGRRAALLQVQNAAGDVRFVAVAVN